MTQTGIVSSKSLFLGHDTRGVIPEIPARATVIHDALWTESRLPNLRAISPEQASDELLRLAHSESHVAELRAIERGIKEAPTSGDNPFLEGTIETARWAAGSVVAAVDAVMRGDIRNAFCAVRPPGHHAFPDHWEGFCYFNNVALGAHHLLKQHQLSRILILDWDLHHGNGTQACFYEDPRVLVVNLHGDPRGIYPYRSGFAEERGRGAGMGFNLNVPLAPGSGDEELQQRYQQEISPAIAAFRPEFVLISAGFDAHREDPFGYLRWSDDAYRWITEQTLAVAESYASGRYVSVLEGGYSLEVLRRVAPLHVDCLIQRRTSS